MAKSGSEQTCSKMQKAADRNEGAACHRTTSRDGVFYNIWTALAKGSAAPCNISEGLGSTFSFKHFLHLIGLPVRYLYDDNSHLHVGQM